MWLWFLKIFASLDLSWSDIKAQKRWPKQLIPLTKFRLSGRSSGRISNSQNFRSCLMYTDIAGVYKIQM